MVKALIIDDDYGQLASAYYAKFPEEPISAKASLKVDATEFIPQTSLLTLLKQILKSVKSAEDLVIASHGNENGMIMPLIPKYGRTAITDNLIDLMSGKAHSEIADHFSLKTSIIDEILSTADSVRKLGLGHIAFRGCSIGDKIRNLTTLRDFLGASEVSATNLLSTYGHVKMSHIKDKKAFESKWKSYEKTAHRYSGKAGRVILWRGTKPKDPFSDLIALFSDSMDVMLEWLQTNFYSGTTKAIATAVVKDVPLHYLSRTPPVLPLDGTQATNAPALGYADFIRNASDPP